MNLFTLFSNNYYEMQIHNWDIYNYTDNIKKIINKILKIDD